MNVIKIITGFLLFYLFVTLHHVEPQVPIVVLDGTNFIDYRVLNTNFLLLNYRQDKVAITGAAMSGPLIAPLVIISNAPINNADAANKLYVDTRTPGAAFFWLCPTSNNVPEGYYNLCTDIPTDSTEIVISGAIATQGAYIASWIAPTGAVISLLDGAAITRLRAKKSGAVSGTTIIKAEMYVRYADGSEPEYAPTAETMELFPDFTVKSLVTVIESTNLPIDASMVMKIKVVENSNDRDVILTIGNIGFSYVNLPMPAAAVTTGPPGQAATIAIAWTSNSLPGSAAAVTNTGDSNAAAFGFLIPTGSNGPPGEQGIQGIPGEPGPAGLQSPLTNNLYGAGYSATGFNALASSTFTVTGTGTVNDLVVLATAYFNNINVTNMAVFQVTKTKFQTTYSHVDNIFFESEVIDIGNGWTGTNAYTIIQDGIYIFYGKLYFTNPTAGGRHIMYIAINGALPQTSQTETVGAGVNLSLSSLMILQCTNGMQISIRGGTVAPVTGTLIQDASVFMGARIW